MLSNTGHVGTEIVAYDSFEIEFVLMYGMIIHFEPGCIHDAIERVLQRHNRPLKTQSPHIRQGDYVRNIQAIQSAGDSDCI